MGQRLPPISLSNTNVSQGCPSVPPAKCKSMSNCQCLPCGENCHFYKCNNLWCNDQCEGCHSQHQQIEVEVDLRKEPLSDPTNDLRLHRETRSHIAWRSCTWSKWSACVLSFL